MGKKVKPEGANTESQETESEDDRRLAALEIEHEIQDQIHLRWRY
jgi:hypothetical protein